MGDRCVKGGEIVRKTTTLQNAAFVRKVLVIEALCFEMRNCRVNTQRLCAATGVHRAVGRTVRLPGWGSAHDLDYMGKPSLFPRCGAAPCGPRLTGPSLQRGWPLGEQQRELLSFDDANAQLLRFGQLRPGTRTRRNEVGLLGDA